MSNSNISVFGNKIFLEIFKSLQNLILYLEKNFNSLMISEKILFPKTDMVKFLMKNDCYEYQNK